MPQLTILCEQAQQYAEFVEQLALPDLRIYQAVNNAEDLTKLDEIQLILGTPAACASIVKRCPKLLWLQSTWAGVYPLLQKTKQDYALTGVKDLFGKQMREYVFTYMLNHVKKVSEFESLQKTKQWNAPKLDSLYGKTLGIIGVGSIGKEVAKLAKAFNMQVLGLTLNSRDCSDVDQYFHATQWQVFAEKLDFLVMLLPQTSQSEQLVDAAFLGVLPKHCLLINAGRANALDEHALIDVLEQRSLAGAVLDVFRVEPLPQGHPLWTTPNLTITQHTAAISHPQEIVEIFARNYLHFVQSEPFEYLIDWQKGY